MQRLVTFLFEARVIVGKSLQPRFTHLLGLFPEDSSFKTDLFDRKIRQMTPRTGRTLYSGKFILSKS